MAIRSYTEEVFILPEVLEEVFTLDLVTGGAAMTEFKILGYCMQ